MQHILQRLSLKLQHTLIPKNIPQWKTSEGFIYLCNKPRPLGGCSFNPKVLLWMDPVPKYCSPNSWTD